ncbi:helix-turn-helix transcriptional regulator [Streptomyces sp. NPDC006458]|uniref:helix-turn-helix domain-containing protein n=1 Tax=Streptomyces sp. NPDC006458 TaxID=3154302 RepID=UPI0033AECE4F
MAEHLGDRMKRLRRVAGLTQEALAEKARLSVDTVKKLEQKQRHSAALPTLHALSSALGVELTSLLGDPPGVPSTGEADPPQLVALRRAVSPPLFLPPPEPTGAERLTLPVLRKEISAAWTLYHDAEFSALLDVLPGIVNDARFAASVGTADQRADGEAALGKALQLAGHLAIRLGKLDLALSALERAMNAASASSDPLLSAMITNSVAWNYQRQNRLGDAEHVAVYAADRIEHENSSTAEGVRVWGGLVMSAATSAARRGDYDRASDMMKTAEDATKRLATLPPPVDGKMVSVFSRSSVRIERVRLAVQHARPEEALDLAKGMRLSADTPPSWRTWLLLDVARAHTDLGNAEGAVKALTRLKEIAPGWMRHHTLAVAIVTDLWAGPARPVGLRKLAEFLGVIS